MMSGPPSFTTTSNTISSATATTMAPFTLRLLETLCGDDKDKIFEAETAAEEAICARIRFWDGILDAIAARRDSDSPVAAPR